jgi:hypothetical protein
LAKKICFWPFHFRCQIFCFSNFFTDFSFFNIEEMGKGKNNFWTEKKKWREKKTTIELERRWGRNQKGKIVEKGKGFAHKLRVKWANWGEEGGLVLPLPVFGLLNGKTMVRDGGGEKASRRPNQGGIYVKQIWAIGWTFLQFACKLGTKMYNNIIALIERLGEN